MGRGARESGLSSQPWGPQQEETRAEAQTQKWGQLGWGLTWAQEGQPVSRAAQSHSQRPEAARVQDAKGARSPKQVTVVLRSVPLRE